MSIKDAKGNRMHFFEKYTWVILYGMGGTFMAFLNVMHLWGDIHLHKYLLVQGLGVSFLVIGAVKAVERTLMERIRDTLEEKRSHEERGVSPLGCCDDSSDSDDCSTVKHNSGARLNQK